MVRRVYVEKKPDYAVQARELSHEISSYLGITDVTNVRVLIRYDVENISAYFPSRRWISFTGKILKRQMEPECFPWNICRDSLTRGRIPPCSAFSS